MKTNYILLFALMLMVSLKSSAQIFSGRVIGENQLPVEYATVALLSVPDSALVGGAVTDSKGVFKIIGTGCRALFVVCVFCGL